MRLATGARGRRAGGPRACSSARARSPRSRSCRASPVSRRRARRAGRARGRDLRAVGAVAPVRDTVPLDDPRTRSPRWSARARRRSPAGSSSSKRSRPRRPRLSEYPAEAAEPSRRHVARARGADFEGTRFLGTRAATGLAARTRSACSSACAAPRRSRSAPARRRRARAARRVRARRILVCSRDAARLRQPDPGRGRGAPLAAATSPRSSSSTSTGARCSCRPRSPIAARTHRALLEELRRRGRPTGPRSASTARASAPGRARTCSAAAACGRSTRRGVARALWIGTPYFSPLPRLARDRARIPTDARVGERGGRSTSWPATSEPPNGCASCSSRRARTPSCSSAGLDLIWRRPEWLPPGSLDAGHHVPAARSSTSIAATNWPSTMPAGARPRLPAGGPGGGRPRVRPSRRPRRGSPSWPTGWCGTSSSAAPACGACGAASPRGSVGRCACSSPSSCCWPCPPRPRPRRSPWCSRTAAPATSPARSTAARRPCRSRPFQGAAGEANLVGVRREGGDVRRSATTAPC